VQAVIHVKDALPDYNFWFEQSLENSAADAFPKKNTSFNKQ
jgi:hypothetical protein